MQTQTQLPEEFKSEKYAKAQGWNIPKEKPIDYKICPLLSMGKNHYVFCEKARCALYIPEYEMCALRDVADSFVMLLRHGLDVKVEKEE